MAFGTQPELDDLNDVNEGMNRDGGLPADFGDEGLNLEGLDGQVDTYNDLGEFCATDDLGQQYVGDDAMDFDEDQAQVSPGYNADQPIANDLEGFE